MGTKTKVVEKYATDEVMHQTVLSLLRDFRSALTDEEISKLRDAVRSRSISKIREAAPAVDFHELDPHVLKRRYQLASINKRHRYQADIYSDDELTCKAVNTFMETQSRIRAIDLGRVDEFTSRTLSLARVFIRRVLGVLNEDEHLQACRFGRRASVGIPARDASLAQRWELPISGSLNQAIWFDSVMSDVSCVQEYWAAQLHSDPFRSVYQLADCLKLTLVPKTFKSLRSIMPNTTIGSYMSFGIGDIMAKRLRKHRSDIRTLQSTHRILACRASEHGQHVTADLSSASDSISVALVRHLLPQDWFDFMNEHRVSKVELPDGDVVEMETFSTMGIGYTFPLQTLIFLSLLRAVHFQVNGFARATISVYGDDLIYHKSIHSMVQHVFKEIGFVINIDKTFDEGHFRESCGGDYHRGVDVRPFQPQNGHPFVSRIAYEALLYKYLNGLLRRWTEFEIPETISYLTSELERVTKGIKIVPRDFPDDSGLKVKGRHDQYCFIDHVATVQPVSKGHGVFSFPYLAFTMPVRKEERHEPYLWATLDAGARQADNSSYRTLGRPGLSFAQSIDALNGWDTPESPLISVEDKPVRTFRSSVSGRRLRKTSTYLPCNQGGKYKRQFGASTFGPADEMD